MRPEYKFLKEWDVKQAGKQSLVISVIMLQVILRTLYFILKSLKTGILFPQLGSVMIISYSKTKLLCHNEEWTEDMFGRKENCWEDVIAMLKTKNVLEQ